MESTANAPTPSHSPFAHGARDQGDIRGTAQESGGSPSEPPCLFSSSCRRADLVARYPDTDAECERIGFGWNLSIGEWCTESTWALLTLARAAKPPPPAPDIDWSMATLPELTDAIITTHHQPLRDEVRRLDLLITEFCNRHPELASLGLIELFASYANTMIAHIDHEESTVFPLSIAIEEASRHTHLHVPCHEDITAAIRFMSLGHADGSMALLRLIAILSDIPPQMADPDIALICDGVNAMLHDLVAHEDKEEDILLPAVIFAEEQLRTRMTEGTHSHRGP